MDFWNNLTASSRIQVSIVKWAWLVVSHDHCTDKLTYKQNSLENYGSLLVWDAAMPQLKPVMDKYKDRQRAYR